MSIIFLFGAVQALFFVVLILSKKEKHSPDYLLITWLIAMGVHLLSYYVIHEELFDSPVLGPFLLLFPPLIYIHGPLLYLYTLSLSQKNRSFEWKDLLHFIPFVASMVYYLYSYKFMAGGDLRYFTLKPIAFEYLNITFYLLNIFLNPVYVLIVLFRITEHQRKIRMNFSYSENINLNWLKFLAIGLGAVSITVWISHIISNFVISDPEFSRDFWIFLSLTVFVFITGYFGFRQGVIYKFNPEVAKPYISKSNPKESSGAEQFDDHRKYEKSRLSPEEARIILQKLNSLMIEEKAFVRSDLNLEDVAKEIDVSSHTLSQLLNVFLKKNFFNYVNEHRVNHVKQMLLDSRFDSYSLLGIAEESGFNAKSSFNRIFKNVTGMTPSQYKSNSPA